MESAKVNNKIVVVCSFWRASHMVWSMWCFGFVWSKISNDNDWQNRIRMLLEECVRLLLSILFSSIATSIQWNGFSLPTLLEKSCPELDGENSRELWFAIHWSRALCGSCRIFAFEFINLSINQFSSYLRMSFLVGFSPCVKRFLRSIHESGCCEMCGVDDRVSHAFEWRSRRRFHFTIDFHWLGWWGLNSGRWWLQRQIHRNC